MRLEVTSAEWVGNRCAFECRHREGEWVVLALDGAPFDKATLDAIAKDGPSAEDIILADLEGQQRKAQEELDRRVVAGLAPAQGHHDQLSEMCMHGIQGRHLCPKCAGYLGKAKVVADNVPQAMSTAADFAKAITSDLRQRKLVVGDRVKIINGATKGPSWVEKHEWTVTRFCADGAVEIQGSGDRNGLFMQIAESETILLEFQVGDIVELMDSDGDYSRRGHHRVRRGADASGYLEIEKVGGSSPSICQVVAWCAKLVKRTDPGGVYDANDKGLLERIQANAKADREAAKKGRGR